MLGFNIDNEDSFTAHLPQTPSTAPHQWNPSKKGNCTAQRDHSRVREGVRVELGLGKEPFFPLGCPLPPTLLASSPVLPSPHCSGSIGRKLLQGGGTHALSRHWPMGPQIGRGKELPPHRLTFHCRILFSTPCLNTSNTPQPRKPPEASGLHLL